MKNIDIDPLEYLLDQNMVLNNPYTAIEKLKKKYSDCKNEIDIDTYIQKLVDDAQKNANKYLS